MNLNNYTIKAREAVERAVQEAQALKHQSVENGHLLKAISLVADDVMAYLFHKMEVNTQAINHALESVIKSYPMVEGGETYLSSETASTLNKAQSISTSANDKYITIETLLLALFESKSQVSQLLKDAGVTKKALDMAVSELRKGKKAETENAESNFNALERYGINLNKQAINGKLDPVIGREDEIRRVIQILSRRTKNNPILVGEPGVGKTAIAEGLAHRIVNNDVPENLKTKQIFSLDLGALIAGAKYKGEFEERLKSVVKEVVDANGEIIMFIDEIHTLVGAGKGEGAMDAANILKPALARGELRAVGATTLNEYQKFFEKDKALERRFQMVLVDEPDIQSAVAILRGLKERYEVHHKVKIKDEAIVAAVELSHRYITDRFLPDKAIDLIDEAASKLRLQIDSLPPEIDDLQRTIMQLEIEREAMKREGKTQREKEIVHSIASLSEQLTVLKARWQREKDMINRVQQLKHTNDELKQQADKAEREGNYGLVAEIRYGKMKETQEEIEKAETQIKEIQAQSAMLREEVLSEDISAIIAKWTGIPLERMLKSEKEKYLNLEAELHKRVVGQHHAITAVSDAVRRSRAGLQDEKRPIGSFIFLGTTGVGKTELARALAELLFDNESMMTRIDMSEYQEKHSVSRLVGAPPGYVGYDEGGQLTEAVRRKPYSIVLFDEIEKAHPDVFNVLLQVLDDGRLTDNKGRTVNFKNTIIIMTSNMGSNIIQEGLSNLNDNNKDELITKTQSQLFELMRKTIRPEFLNRIDELIMFLPLSHNENVEIADLHLKRIVTQLSKQGVHIRYTKALTNYIAGIAFDPQFGARPVKRKVQTLILNPLSRLIIDDKISETQQIEVDVNQNNEVIFINR